MCARLAADGGRAFGTHDSADMLRTISKQLQLTASPRQQERSRRANQEEGSCQSGSYCSAAAESDRDTESTRGAVAATNTVLRGSTLSTCCVEVIPSSRLHFSIAAWLYQLEHTMTKLTMMPVSVAAASESWKRSEPTTVRRRGGARRGRGASQKKMKLRRTEQGRSKTFAIWFVGIELRCKDRFCMGMQMAKATEESTEYGWRKRRNAEVGAAASRAPKIMH